MIISDFFSVKMDVKKGAKSVTDKQSVATYKPFRHVSNVLWNTATAATFNRDIRVPFTPDYMVLRHVCPHIGVNPAVTWQIRCSRLIPESGIITTFMDGGGVMSVSFTPQTEFQMHGAVNDNFTFELLNSAGNQATSTGFVFLQLEFYKC